ncbi:hypothetical protein BDZ89DRAFT_967487, partial [Hymenopellis radicata]
WATVRRLGGGDDMKAAALMSSLADDRRDATFIRYDLLVDINARFPRRKPQFHPQMFFGQLENILVVHLPPIPELELEEEQVLLLAHIHRCETTLRKLHTREVPVYTKMGRHEVVDMSAVQCVVGRIPPVPGARPQRWAILDRSGTLQRSYYVPDE